MRLSARLASGPRKTLVPAAKFPATTLANHAREIGLMVATRRSMLEVSPVCQLACLLKPEEPLAAIAASFPPNTSALVTSSSRRLMSRR